ncbi:P-type ATPase, cytoplasmic domain N [Pseudocohnilembus persalinus]|uniref:Phospholipid-transporting ATPase n=1 Tax=Pseudocohnilembus persalinus TaxID=266149 RepID=A0A0V0QS59_PSEPJ|nr:P-type ATPase, cytoplasmic domain N [Pseudocohnilembus persalinus]|eukprot:KRX05129.1 P-type ATPase, cytoplasmic domain N [Pseudocohnilembus persalinus]
MEEKDSEIQQPLIVKETSDLEEGIPGLYSTAGFANPEKNLQNQKNKNQNQQTKKLQDNDFSDQQQQLNGQNQYKNINYSNIDLTKQRLVYLDGTVYPQRNKEDVNLQQDDKHRRLINKNINQQPYKILTAASEEIVACKDIKVGDLLLLGPNQRVPCDIILLHTPSEENGQLFVNTEQIDGKSDIQIRRSVKFTHNYAKSNSLYTLKACVEVGPPNKLINSFHGKFKNESSGQEQIVENLSVYNTVWANSYLTSGRAIGLVIYTGNNTKSQMNWERFHYKIPKVDQEMNKLTYIYFIFILALSTSVSVLEGFDSSWNYEFVRNLIMYLAVLPISIRFCLTISKILLVNRIEKDTSFKNIKVNNRNNPEDLGRFEFMLCDKTGTITSTQMTFKKIRLFDLEYDYTQIEEMKQIIAQKSKFLGICADLNEKTKVKFRDTDHELRDTFTCITICNNVVPIGQGEDVTYQTSSQDEISLVKLSESLGIRLLKKNKDVVQIENAQKEKETYQIVQEFPFTAEQRKMGILFCCRENGKYIYLTKGAEDAMVKVLPERQMPFIMEQNEILTSQGLRTMIYGYRYIPEKEFKKWYLTYGEALKNNPFSDLLKRTAQEDIEKGVQFLSISGVEEQVNEKVKETFESIRGSGIRVWMVTGDNINTTKRIAILSGFKPEGYDFITFKQITDEYQMSLELTQLDKALSISRKKIVVLDSVSYKTAIRFKESYFFDLLKVCHSVICCNFTPAQKASLTLSVKRHFKNANYVVSVGNGINDIQMFQKSDYSICISDEPNNSQLKQATIASDLRISKFKDIDKLLQYYGLNGYKRSTVMLSYLVQRGTILTTIQAVFTMLFDVTIQIFSPMLTTLITIWL